MKNADMPEGWGYRKASTSDSGKFGFIITKEDEYVRTSTAIFDDEDGLAEQFLFALLAELEATK